MCDSGRGGAVTGTDAVTVASGPAGGSTTDGSDDMLEDALEEFIMP